MTRRNHDRVRTYTDLNMVCTRDGHTHLLRVWYWLRYKDIAGCGWISKVDFIAYVNELGLGKARALQIFNDGLGTWWEISGVGICIVGLDRVANMLETPAGDTVQIPVSTFDTLLNFRAHIYASWFTKDSWKKVCIDDSGKMVPAGGKTISRQTLRSLFGISERTQIRYEKIADIQVTPQYGYSKVTEDNIEKLPHRENKIELEKCGVWCEDIDGDGVDELVWQIPNRYTVALDLIKDCCKERSNNGGLTNSDEASRSSKRLYYDNINKAAKDISRNRIPSPGVYVPSIHKVNKRLCYEYIPKCD